MDAFPGLVSKLSGSPASPFWIKMKLEPWNATCQFSKIPNEILFANELTPQERLTWCQLESICFGRDYKLFRRGFVEIASIFSVPYTSLLRSIRGLKAKGYLEESEDGHRLLFPWAYDEIQKVEKETPVAPEPLEKVKEEPPDILEPVKKAPQPDDFTIRNAVEEKPNQKPTGIDPKDSWKDLCEAWNKNKPDNWMLADGKYNAAVFMTLSEHCKRLGIPRSELPDFVGQVAKGCSVDEWWKDKSGICIPQVFGYYVAKLTDSKYQMVEKLYRLGVNKISKFSWNDDQSILHYFRKACPDQTFKTVQKISLKTLDEACDHELEHRGNGVVFVYDCDDFGPRAHWSYHYDYRYPRCHHNPATL
jgi:hypothetical protein